jgi:hypothetical protein
MQLEELPEEILIFLLHKFAPTDLCAISLLCKEVCCLPIHTCCSPHFIPFIPFIIFIAEGEKGEGGAGRGEGVFVYH